MKCPLKLPVALCYNGIEESGSERLAKSQGASFEKEPVRGEESTQKHGVPLLSNLQAVLHFSLVCLGFWAMLDLAQLHYISTI